MLHKVLIFLKTQLKTAVISPDGQDAVAGTSVVNEKGELNTQSGQVSLTLKKQLMDSTIFQSQLEIYGGLNTMN